MAKTLLGDLCADLGPRSYGEGRDYKKIGVAFEDERGRISVKIDTLPIPGGGWQGWCNIFEEKNRPTKSTAHQTPGPPNPHIDDDDIPF